MGVYSLFFANSKQYKALSIFNRTLSYIQDDPRNRMFLVSSAGESALDYDSLMEFDELAKEFRILFGTESPEYVERKLPDGKVVYLEKERPFSYRDLMTPAPPEPAEDKVYIQRAVPLIYAWGNRPAPYVAFKIGFVYTVTEYMQTPAGAFPIQKQVPMFSWDDPDIRSGRTKSNCVPYTYYQQQKVRLINELMSVVSKLEAKIARYLHQEGYTYQSQEARQGSMKDDDWTDNDDNNSVDDDELNDDSIVDEEGEGANDE